MGNGPGYDARDSRIDKDLLQKRKRQNRRIEILNMMISEVGFGDTDPEQNRIDKMVTKSLKEVYDLLVLLVRN